MKTKTKNKALKSVPFFIKQAVFIEYKNDIFLCRIFVYFEYFFSMSVIISRRR